MLALVGGLSVLWAAPGDAAMTAAQKCQATKLVAAGKDAACQASALAKAALGGTNTVSQCDAKLGAVFTKLEAKGGCATKGDAPTIAARIDSSSLVVRASVFFPGGPVGPPGNGDQLVDNGDGTVTDLTTGLQWEQQSFDPTSLHYFGNFYTWSSTGCVNGPPIDGFLVSNPADDGTAADGTLFTTFLATLNNASGPGGCFAGHCDWRLPTFAELDTIVDPLVMHCADPALDVACIDPIFGPAGVFYWAPETLSSSATMEPLMCPILRGLTPPIQFPSLSFDKCADGFPVFFGILPISVRAVRTAGAPNCGNPGQPCCGAGVCYQAGTVCSAGGTCMACPTGQTDCSGRCVNLMTDLNNCGGCGNVCNEACVAGVCTIP
jgi:hypothetical protein